MFVILVVLLICLTLLNRATLSVRIAFQVFHFWIVMSNIMLTTYVCNFVYVLSSNKNLSLAKCLVI